MTCLAIIWGNLQIHDCSDSAEEDIPLRQTRQFLSMTEEYERYMDCIVSGPCHCKIMNEN